MRKAQIRAGYDLWLHLTLAARNCCYLRTLREIRQGFISANKDTRRERGVPAEADELSASLRDIQGEAEVLQDLPIRLAEFARSIVRAKRRASWSDPGERLYPDDAHIFCRPDQVKEEFIKVIDLVLHVFNSLGFENYTAQISLRDPANKQKYMGEDELWDRAEREIQEAADERGLKTVAVKGEAAFYGPKLDFMVKDALGRSWQLGTIQVDYQLPQRFALEYVGSDNQKHTPVMIHRAPFGSMERFIARTDRALRRQFPFGFRQSR